MSLFKWEHTHYWAATHRNAVGPVGVRCDAEVTTWRCYACGGIRYDKVDALGLATITVTDQFGTVTKTWTR